MLLPGKRIRAFGQPRNVHRAGVAQPDQITKRPKPLGRKGRSSASRHNCCARWLSGLTEDPGHVAIAIEIPRGAVVETLVERGFHVYAINPKQLDRFRDRYSICGAKDDRRDAFVLADSLRTDQPCFRRVRLDDPRVIQLRELSRVDEDLQREANQLANRLREQLHRFYMQVLKLCPAADEPWLWTLLELAPSPSVAQRLPAKRVELLLRGHRIRRLSADDVISALRVPARQVAPGVVEAATEHIACSCRACAWSTASASVVVLAWKLCSTSFKRMRKTISQGSTATLRFSARCRESGES